MPVNKTIYIFIDYSRIYSIEHKYSIPDDYNGSGYIDDNKIDEYSEGPIKLVDINNYYSESDWKKNIEKHFDDLDNSAKKIIITFLSEEDHSDFVNRFDNKKYDIFNFFKNEEFIKSFYSISFNRNEIIFFYPSENDVKVNKVRTIKFGLNDLFDLIKDELKDIENIDSEVNLSSSDNKNMLKKYIDDDNAINDLINSKKLSKGQLSVVCLLEKIINEIGIGQNSIITGYYKLYSPFFDENSKYNVIHSQDIKTVFTEIIKPYSKKIQNKDLQFAENNLIKNFKKEQAEKESEAIQEESKQTPPDPEPIIIDEEKKNKITILIDYIKSYIFSPVFSFLIIYFLTGVFYYSIFSFLFLQFDVSLFYPISIFIGLPIGVLASLFIFRIYERFIDKLLIIFIVLLMYFINISIYPYMDEFGISQFFYNYYNNYNHANSSVGLLYPGNVAGPVMYVMLIASLIIFFFFDLFKKFKLMWRIPIIFFLALFIIFGTSFVYYQHWGIKNLIQPIGDKLNFDISRNILKPSILDRITRFYKETEIDKTDVKLNKEKKIALLENIKKMITHFYIVTRPDLHKDDLIYVDLMILDVKVEGLNTDQKYKEYEDFIKNNELVPDCKTIIFEAENYLLKWRELYLFCIAYEIEPLIEPLIDSVMRFYQLDLIPFAKYFVKKLFREYFPELIKLTVREVEIKQVPDIHKITHQIYQNFLKKDKKDLDPEFNIKNFDSLLSTVEQLTDSKYIKNLRHYYKKIESIKKMYDDNKTAFEKCSKYFDVNELSDYVNNPKIDDLKKFVKFMGDISDNEKIKKISECLDYIDKLDVKNLNTKKLIKEIEKHNKLFKDSSKFVKKLSEMPDLIESFEKSFLDTSENGFDENKIKDFIQYTEDLDKLFNNSFDISSALKNIKFEKFNDIDDELKNQLNQIQNLMESLKTFEVIIKKSGDFKYLFKNYKNIDIDLFDNTIDTEPIIIEDKKTVLDTSEVNAELIRAITSPNVTDNLKIIDEFLKNGADPNFKDEKNLYTSLMYCSFYTTPVFLEITDKILTNSIVKLENDNIFKSLDVAISRNNYNFFMKLNEKGFDISDQTKCVLINKLINLGQLNAVEALIENGVNLNYIGSNNTAPLHVAALKDTESVGLLLRKGANINLCRAADGYSALMISEINKKWDIAMFLIEKGADLSIEGKDGYTALTIAVHNDSYHIIDALLDKGVNINETSKNKNITSGNYITALSVARNEKMKKYLKQKGAKSNIR